MSSIEKAIERLSKAKSVPDTGYSEEEASEFSPHEITAEEAVRREATPQLTEKPEMLDLSSLSKNMYLVPGCSNKTLSEEYRSHR